MNSLHLKHGAADRLTYAAWVVALGLAFGGHANGVVAAPEAKSTTPRTRTVSLAEIEQAFWICDHAATKGGIDGDTALICVAITDELQKRKFSGDFERMVAWWRQNKPAQHRTLDKADDKQVLMM